jgi:hypothetical protein
LLLLFNILIISYSTYYPVNAKCYASTTVELQWYQNVPKEFLTSPALSVDSPKLFVPSAASVE